MLKVVRQMLEISQDLFPSSGEDINDFVHRFHQFHQRNKKAHCHLSLSTLPCFQSPLLILRKTAPVKMIHTSHMQHISNSLFIAYCKNLYLLSIHILHINHLCFYPWLQLKIVKMINKKRKLLLFTLIMYYFNVQSCAYVESNI